MNKVFMSKRNGELVVGRPIFFEFEEEDQLEGLATFQIGITVTARDQIGYAIFHGDTCYVLWTNEQIKKAPLVDLGDL